MRYLHRSVAASWYIATLGSYLFMRGSVSKYQVGSGHLHHLAAKKSQLILIGRFARVADIRSKRLNLIYWIRHRKEELIKVTTQMLGEAESRT